MSDKIVHITDESFEDDVLKAEHPVLVDYWAEWCGPCKVIAPILGEIAEEYAGKLQVAKLNIDENPATPPKYGIRGIPYLDAFQGRKCGSHQGRGPLEVTAVGLSRQQSLRTKGTGPRNGVPYIEKPAPAQAGRSNNGVLS